MLVEEPKRLAPSTNTLRELFLKSGNLCAYPACSHLMMDINGDFIGQVCHIEAAETGGQRFNSKMTNEERRAFRNLMLMCHAHHKITDNVLKYPVNKLQEMKADHERRYTSPEKLMLDSIKDWTRSNAVSYPKNLRKLTDFIGQSYSQDELKELLESVISFIDVYQKIPLEIRSFFSAAIARIQLMSDTSMVINDGWSERAIYVKDLESAFRMTPAQVSEYAESLSNYGIAYIKDVEDYNYRTSYVFKISEVDDWPFWSDVARYCAANDQDISRYTIEMRFDDLDH